MCRACRERRDERIEPVESSFSNMADGRSSCARVYKFSLLCSGFASVSGTTFRKTEVDMSNRVHAVATPLNTGVVRVSPVAFVVTSVSRRAVRQALHVSSRHVMTFSYDKMHGLDIVS